MAGRHVKKDFDHARDRLFVEIKRCGVLEAEEEDVEPWLEDAIGWLGGEFPSLGDLQLTRLHQIGRNYAAPVIPHGRGVDATNRDEWEDEVDEVDETADAVVSQPA